MRFFSSLKAKFFRTATACCLVGAFSFALLTPATPSAVGCQSLRTPPETPEHTYQLETENDQSVFRHKSAGYELTLPGEPEVHFDAHQLSTDFRWENKRLRVYKQYTTDGLTPPDVVAYSTGTIEADFSYRQNPTDHAIITSRPVWINGQPAFLMTWARTPLKHLPDDMPYYCTIDLMPGDNTVATLLFTSRVPFDDVTSELEIARSYQNQRATTPPYIAEQGHSDPSHRHLSPETRALYDTYFSPEATLAWGIFEPTYSNFDYHTLRDLEDSLDYTFPFVVHYMDFTRSDPDVHIRPILTQAAQEGRCVELTLQTIDPPGGPSQVYEVLNGAHDTYLRHLATAIRESGGPVLMRIGNEMNGDWCDYCAYHLSRDADIYVAFYRYIHDFLAAEGVGDQLLYVWNPNNQSFPNFSWNQPALYYPGDAYVDILGMTAYNTGTYYPSEHWLEFSYLYDETWDTLTTAYRQPVMITEFACSSIGGDKPAWTRRALQHMHAYEGLKVAIWWNHADYDPSQPTVVSRPYYLTDPPEMIPLLGNIYNPFRKPS